MMQEIELDFPAELVEEIEAILSQTGETFSDFVSRALKAALKDLDEGRVAGGVPFGLNREDPKEALPQPSVGRDDPARRQEPRR